ncbi:hypothetical protein Vadar_010441 [Vaccinium darrowii]|uniref:Uncharacterized protein n=1 Tax=Vaccinium darrowii TaxID=229202 RepID=A0ACB7WZI7_9ERIC|nr:hypothetical protein Vadar_010441 [Vaccinium darrowii]
MDEPPPPKTAFCRWISNVNAFFHVPNPQIFHLFIISSTATFSLGTAMIIEWFYHGQHHPGYRWIVYLGPSIVVFPIVMLIICLVSAQIFAKKNEDKHGLSVINRSNSNRTSETKTPIRLKIQDGEVQFELVDTSSDEELIRQVGEQPRMHNDVNLALTRSLSYQISCAGSDKKRNMKRWMSF